MPFVAAYAHAVLADPAKDNSKSLFDIAPWQVRLIVGLVMIAVAAAPYLWRKAKTGNYTKPDREFVWWDAWFPVIGLLGIITSLGAVGVF